MIGFLFSIENRLKFCVEFNKVHAKLRINDLLTLPNWKLQQS